MAGAHSPGRRACITGLAALAAQQAPGSARAQVETRSRSEPGGQARAPGHAGPLPAPLEGRWRFGVYYGSYERGMRVASIELSLQLTGSRYLLQSAGRAEGLVALVWSGVLAQKSEGLVTPAGLAPERYWEQRGKRPERWAALDRRRREISFSSSDPVPLVDGVQDRLSVMVQLGLLARAGPQRLAPGRAVELPELHSRRVERSRWLSHGDDALRGPDGALRALHLERTGPYEPGDARVDLWLGYDLQLMPVRLRLSDPDGRVLDQLIDLRSGP